MVYLTTFKTALLYFPLVAFLITIPFILIQYHKYGSINKIRVFIIYSFILYLMTIYFLVILPLPSIDEVKTMTSPKIQLIPFSFIADFIKETPLIITRPNTYLKALCHSSFYTVLFNIVMTIPFGMYLRYYFKCNLKQIFIDSFLLSLFFELTQLSGLYFIYPRPYRLFDVDDLMLNTLGGVVGYSIMGKLKRLFPTREEIDRKSFEAGKVVSGFRRITLFCLDFIIYSFLTGIISIFLKYSIVKYVIFILYFIIIPCHWNSRTIGSNFLKIKLETSRHRAFHLFFRWFLIYLYYVRIPFGIISLFSLINLDISIKMILMVTLWICLFLFYWVSIVKVLKNQTLIYDRLSKVQLVSTIKS